MKALKVIANFTFWKQRLSRKAKTILLTHEHLNGFFFAPWQCNVSISKSCALKFGRLKDFCFFTLRMFAISKSFAINLPVGLY